MGFWNNIKNFAQPYAADDDYDDDEYYDDEPETADSFDEAPRSSRQEESVSDSAFSSGVSGSTFGSGSVGSAFSQSGTASAFSAASASRGSVAQAIEKHQLVLCVPTVFSDSSTISKNLCENRAVILNVDGVEKDLSRRTVDFLSGCIFALGGSVKKVSRTVYLFCPRDMEVLGDLKDFQTEIEDYI